VVERPEKMRRRKPELSFFILLLLLEGSVRGEHREGGGRYQGGEGGERRERRFSLNLRSRLENPGSSRFLCSSSFQSRRSRSMFLFHSFLVPTRHLFHTRAAPQFSLHFYPSLSFSLSYSQQSFTRHFFRRLFSSKLFSHGMSLPKKW